MNENFDAPPDVTPERIAAALAFNEHRRAALKLKLRRLSLDRIGADQARARLVAELATTARRLLTLRTLRHLVQNRNELATPPVEASQYPRLRVGRLRTAQLPTNATR